MRDNGKKIATETVSECFSDRIRYTPLVYQSPCIINTSILINGQAWPLNSE